MALKVPAQAPKAGAATCRDCRVAKAIEETCRSAKAGIKIKHVANAPVLIARASNTDEPASPQIKSISEDQNREEYQARSGSRGRRRDADGHCLSVVLVFPASLPLPKRVSSATGLP